MANMIIEMNPFECSDPIFGNTIRGASGDIYYFNWTWEGDTYNSYGIPTEVNILYRGAGEPIYTVYPQSAPNNANNFEITLPSYDEVDFQVVFKVKDGELCDFTKDIPYSDVIH